MGLAGLGAGAVQGGASLAAAKIQADAQLAQSQWQERQLEFNRSMIATQRNEVENIAQQDVVRRQDEIRAMFGLQKVAYASSGVKLEGSALEVMEDTARQGREDVLTIQNNAWREAWGLQVKEADLSMQKGFAKAGGLSGYANTMLTGGLQFASSLAGGYEKDLKRNA